jgi:P-type Ca2+ transporter type 2C
MTMAAGRRSRNRLLPIPHLEGSQIPNGATASNVRATNGIQSRAPRLKRSLPGFFWEDRLLELIIDPACSIVFEAEEEEADVMKRPPRSATEHLFSRQMVIMSLLQGFGVLVILLAIFAVALHRGQGEADARALTFTSLVLANVALIITNRSWSRGVLATLQTPNLAMWWVVGSALVFLALVLYVPPIKELFHFSTLHPNDIGLCVSAVTVSFAWFETLKGLQRRRRS